MSIDYSTYVGPYVRCAVERVPVTRMQITCPTKTCDNHGKSMRQPFCSLCGVKVASLPHTEEDFAIDHWDISEEINEALHTPSGDEYYRWSIANATHLWLPNLPMPGRSPYLDSRADFALFDIAESQRNAEILQFQITFGDAIAHLKKRYGAISFHWGVVQYYS